MKITSVWNLLLHFTVGFQDPCQVPGRANIISWSDGLSHERNPQQKAKRQTTNLKKKRKATENRKDENIFEKQTKRNNLANISVEALTLFCMGYFLTNRRHGGWGIYAPQMENALVHQNACTNIFFVYLFYGPNVFLGHIKEKSTSIGAHF